MTHELICGIGDIRKFRNISEIGTNDAEELALVISFGLIDFFNRLLAKKVTPESINRIRRIN